MALTCPICKKKFETLSSLREHHYATHPNARFVAPTPERFSKKLLVLLIAVMIVSGSLVGYLIYAQASQKDTVHTGLLNSTISPTLYQNLTTVSDSTLAAIGYNQSGDYAPAAISPPGFYYESGSPPKPEILFIGAEWCPYCAAERWSLIVALSKFGNFSGLEYMQSAEDEDSIATFTFVNATYSSPYISFVAVEHQDRNHNTLQTPTAEEQSLWDTYTPSGEANPIPFVYIYGQYYLTGAQYEFSSLVGLNWTQIGSQLNNPSSSTAKLIDGAANQLILSICSALQTRNMARPSGLCSQSFASVSYTQNRPYPATSFLILAASVEIAQDSPKDNLP
jgi:Domain of unknown function (DUF929)